MGADIANTAEEAGNSSDKTQGAIPLILCFQ